MKKKVLKIFQSFAQGAISPGGFFQTAAFLGANVKNFLKKWNLWCGSCVFPWIWSVPLPESAGGTELCRYDKTGIVCDLFWHVSGSTFYTDESFYSFRFLYMDFVIFLIFL